MRRKSTLITEDVILEFCGFRPIICSLFVLNMGSNVKRSLWFVLRGSLQKMRLHHSRMLQDLSRKQEALSLEERSLSTRARLTWAQPPHRASAMLVPLPRSSGRSKLQLPAQ